LGLSELQCEQGDLEAARQHLLTSKELGEHAALPELQYRSCVAEARIKEAEGDLDGALDLLYEAERQHISSPVSEVRPAAALKARVWVRQGRLTEALSWVHEQGLSVGDDLSYLREFEHITWQGMLIAQYKSERIERSIHEAMELLERLLQAAEEGEDGERDRDPGAAGTRPRGARRQPWCPRALERALTLAAPEGYVRVFVDEGRPMAQLLSEAAARGIMPDYTAKLLTVLESEEHKSDVGSHRFPTESVVGPLSQRE
jgi:LuxR family maltose regulon positive regulatory protein